MANSSAYFRFLALACAGLLCTACSFHKKKYENPITKDTLQPDKVLFDRAIGDVERGRYEVARLTLNTLINTYDTSEYLAKAKLAIADSWYREGGAHGLGQAEAEYKDFILFYPNMEEAAESQWKVCQIHYKQMEKVDRDSNQAIRAEDECKVLVTQFPNSKYVPQAQQMLRNVQEVLAEKEFLTGAFYQSKGAFPAAANRLSFVADQYPLYSGTPEALWAAGNAYEKMGDRFENEAATDYTRIVKDYPLSDHTDEAKEKLVAMKRPVPTADPAALARMKYEQDNFKKNSMTHTAMSILKRGPETNTAAKAGSPAMTAMRPPTPVSVPPVAASTPGSGGTGIGATSSDVAASVATNSTDIDSKPDARQNPTAPTVANAAAAAGGTLTAAPGTTPGTAPGTTPAATEAAQQPLPTNRPAIVAKKQKKKKLSKQEKAALAAQPTQKTPQ